MSTKKEAHIAIIGAGLAGLTSAYLLQKENQSLNIRIFEASNYIGGRVRTLRNFDNALYAEAGGMIFTDTEKEILSLVDQLGLEKLSRPDRMYGRFYIDDEWSDGLKINQLITLLIDEINKIQLEIETPDDWSEKNTDILNYLDTISIIDFFVKKGEDQSDVSAALSATLVGLYADDLTEVSALDALRFFSQYIDCKTIYSIKGGNDLLPKKLTAELEKTKTTITLNCPVSKISKNSGQWQVNFQDNNISAELFDYVIIATPLSALQAKNLPYIQLPDLSKDRVDMLNNVHYGKSISRVYCQVKNRFWEPDALSGGVMSNKPTLWIEDHTAAQQQTSYAVLEAHALGGIGNKIQQAKNTNEAGEQNIASIYGQSFIENLSAEKTQTVLWSKEIFQKGCYPYFTMGQRGYLKKLSSTVSDSLFFAGEYTCIDSPASMNGAIKSAYKVISEINNIL